ncbi:MAG: hypothetical protein WAX85_00025 [Minisyncoccia bacterium]
MEEQKKNSVLIGSIVGIVLIIAGYGGFKYLNKSNAVAEPETLVTPVTPTPIPQEVPVDIPTSYLYKNGSYSSVGEYNSPGGTESIKVALTLKDDVITDATITPLATRGNSVKFQGIFVSNFRPLVIGKKIDEVQLDKVSGSSLTPKGFNDALAKIKTQAKA